MTEISKEYAEALFALSCETGEEKQMMSALEEVQTALEQNPDFMELLASPSIPLGERLEAIERVFLGRIPEHGLSFLQLLCEKGRIGSFSACVKEYRGLLHMRESMITAKITSAVELTEAERAALKQKLEKKSGSAVLLDCSVDPSLLGGLIVEMNGTVTDGSLSHRLREVKEVMNR